MPTSRYVSTAKELKKALDDKVDWIVITDKKLAFAAKVIKKVGYKTLAGIAVMTGVAAVAAWNPVGWSAGAATGTVGAVAFTSAIASVGGVGAAGISGGTAAAIGVVAVVIGGLGLSALVMHKDYSLEIDSSAGGKVAPTDDKPAVKGKGSFKMTLKRNGS